MRNYLTISDEEKDSILQTHSAFYNGYATGNVPSNLQPLRVDRSVKDFGGVTVDNKGNVKQYTNHRVNEAETNDSDNLNYNVLLGYAMGMSKTLWAEPNKDIDLIGALKELKLYYLDLRNGKTPMVLSVPAQAAKNTVEKLVSELPNGEVTSLEKIGAGLKTLSETDISDEESSYDFDSEGPEDRDEFDGRDSEVVGVDSDIEDQRKEANEIEADNMDISHEDSAYDFESDGPEQFDSSYSDDSYGDDIDAIMKMFGGDMSPASVDGVNDMMNSDLDGKEKYSNEKSAFDFESDGGNADVYGEQSTNMSIGFVEEGEGETDESLVSVMPMDKPIGKIFSLKGNNPSRYEVEEDCGEVEEGCGEVHEGEPCEQCGSEMIEGECKECGSLYEEIEEGLHESFTENRKIIKEMFNRFSKFN